jgi:glycine/D-amino acid oxidase-like deaminating enzyme
VVGAGIAGIASTFFILKNTDKKVVVLEKFKLAHGATGHNGGHLLTVFERDFASIVEEFGLKLAGDGQRDIDSAWTLLDEMYTDAKLDIPLSRFTGHAGFITYDQIMKELKSDLLTKQSGIEQEPILIAEDQPFINDIPRKFEGLYKIVPHKEILEMLETKREEFIAVTFHQAGVMNSALFCEEMLKYMLDKYKDRFSIYEHSNVQKIILHESSVLLDVGDHTLTAEKVVLCTNGFENLIIINNFGLEVNAKYHHNVNGIVGYMSGYLESMNKPPTANAFLEENTEDFNDLYFYLTRRPYEFEPNTKHNLISIGGPELSVEESTKYSYEDDYPDDKVEEIDKFIKQTYDLDQNKKIDYIFTWHGLMGYTKNGIRMVGPEPVNKVLLYNLGCNGIGLLPSIFGGKKISRHIAGENVEKSIFDIPIK